MTTTFLHSSDSMYSAIPFTSLVFNLGCFAAKVFSPSPSMASRRSNSRTPSELLLDVSSSLPEDSVSLRNEVSGLLSSSSSDGDDDNDDDDVSFPLLLPSSQVVVVVVVVVVVFSEAAAGDSASCVSSVSSASPIVRCAREEKRPNAHLSGQKKTVNYLEYQNK
tara:strand:- start:3177 stop:3668 length:492 start_codon:yes stop_codon:yes gene_type:complete